MGVHGPSGLAARTMVVEFSKARTARAGSAKAGSAGSSEAQEPTSAATGAWAVSCMQGKL